MAGFSEAWAAVDVHRNGETVSPGLRPLLQAVYAQCLAQPHNLVELKRSLEDLLTYLAGEGRTNANCWAVDLFFALTRDGSETGQSRNYQRSFTMSSRQWEGLCTTPSMRPRLQKTSIPCPNSFCSV